MSIESSIVSLLYSPHSPIARLDRDGLKAPEIAAAAKCTEDDVYRAMRQIIGAGLVVYDWRTSSYHRPAAMVDRQQQH